MKKYIISLVSAFLVSSAAHGVEEFVYTTQNAYGKWVAGATSPNDSSFNKGRYNSISFTLNADSLNAAIPYDSKGSLTQGTALDGATLTGEDLVAMENYFRDGNQVSLTQINLKGESRNGSSFVADTYMRITDALGNTYTSNVIEKSVTSVSDPWAPGWYHSDDMGVFTFDDTVILEIGMGYTVSFVDESGNILTDNDRPYLDLTNVGDDGFAVAGTTTWSPAGLKIVTKSIIPEPSTVVMSIMTLIGFVTRRRRKIS